MLPELPLHLTAAYGLVAWTAAAPLIVACVSARLPRCWVTHSQLPKSWHARVSPAAVTSHLLRTLPARAARSWRSWATQPTRWHTPPAAHLWSWTSWGG